MAAAGMQPSPVGPAEFSFRNNLTDKQRAAFQPLDPRLKDIIMQRLLKSPQPEDLTTTRLMLDIFASCPDDMQRVADTFFLTVLNAKNDVKDINVSLAKLKKICLLTDGSKAFFKCASTKKVNYYTIQTLKTIIDQFSAKLKPGETTLSSALRNPPCYDEGGEAFFASLNHGAALPLKLLPGVGAEAVPPDVLNDLLTKNTTFKNLRAMVTAYLKGLDEKHRLNMNAYEGFFQYLQSDPHINTLKDEEKCELLKFAIVTTSDLKEEVFQCYTFTDLKEMAEAAQGVHGDCGEEMLLAFCQGLSKQKRASFEEAIQGLRFLSGFSQDLDKLVPIQTNVGDFQSGKIDLAELTKRMEMLVPDTLPPINATEDIPELVRRFEGKDSLVKVPMEAGKLKRVADSYQQIKKYCLQWQKCRLNELVNIAQEIQKKAVVDDDDLSKLAAIARLIIRIKFFPIYLHPNQIFTALGLLQYYPTGCLAQMATGEGKTFIVALFEFLAASKFKRPVYMISSNPSLAVYAQAKLLPFFKAFGMQTSHICHEERKPEHFASPLLYGTASDYEFAIMYEMLYFKTLFPKPLSEVILIVDEADNLTIDTSLDGARYGYPAEVAFSWIYVPIFKFVQQNIAQDQKHKLVSPIVMDQLKAILRDFQGGKYKKQAEALTDQAVQKWQLNAFHALYELELEEQYIIEEKEASDGKKKPRITIIDEDNTGKRKAGSRWSGGIHEFLEIKHNLEVEEETITPISMSHPVFYALFSVVYALTGTAGTKDDREELKLIYGLDTFDAPSNKPSLRKDAPPVIVANNALLLQRTIDRIQDCRRKRRPILVLCKTIRATLDVEKRLKALQIPHEIMNEVQKKNEEDILEVAGLPGAVTIATNNAGRGTDVVLKEDSEKNGGLLSHTAFWPKSKRVEDQARGRAGRQGQPGDSEIVLSAEDLGFGQIPDLDNPQVQAKLIAQLEEGRNVHSRTMKHLHICRAELERFSFRFVKQFYGKLGSFHALSHHDRLLETCARSLCHRLIEGSKPAFSDLRPKDRQIAEEAFKMLQEVQTEPMPWIVLLKQAIERVKEKAINDWVIYFLAQVEEMYADSKIKKFGSLRELVRRFYQQLDNHADDGLLLKLLRDQEEKAMKALDIELDKELEYLKGKIELMYDKFMQKWDQMLDLQGHGLFDYLGEMLGLKLHYPS